MRHHLFILVVSMAAGALSGVVTWAVLKWTGAI